MQSQISANLQQYNYQRQITVDGGYSSHARLDLRWPASHRLQKLPKWSLISLL